MNITILLPWLMMAATPFLPWEMRAAEVTVPPNWWSPPPGTRLDPEFETATIRGDLTGDGLPASAAAVRRGEKTDILVFLTDKAGQHHIYNIWRSKSFGKGATLDLTVAGSAYWLDTAATAFCNRSHIACGKESAPIFQCSCKAMSIVSDNRTYVALWMGFTEGFKVLLVGN